RLGGGTQDVKRSDALSCAARFVRHLAACAVVFFFQAEDGIRDRTVTGVQTCALPILGTAAASRWWSTRASTRCSTSTSARTCARSEERRVGKECRSRGATGQEKKKPKNRGNSA